MPLINLIAYGEPDDFSKYYIRHNITHIVSNYEYKCDIIIDLYNNNKLNQSCKNLIILPDKFINCDKFIWFDCSFNKLIFIPETIYQLKVFDFSSNNIKQIDMYGYPNLKYLIANSNKIKQIKNLSNRLIYLDVSNNPINKFGDFVFVNFISIKLEYLIIVKTKIKIIDLTNFTKLKYLDISMNSLDSNSMDNLPNTLLYLICSHCDIKFLDNLPLSLHTLKCNHNYINNLNMLPSSILELDCSKNLISELDDLPFSIKKLKWKN